MSPRVAVWFLRPAVARSLSSARCYPSSRGCTASTSLLSQRERKSIRDRGAQPFVSKRAKRRWEIFISRTRADFRCTLPEESKRQIHVGDDGDLRDRPLEKVAVTSSISWRALPA